MQIFVVLFFPGTVESNEENIATLSAVRCNFHDQTIVFFCQTPNTIVRDHIPDSMVQNYEQMNTEKMEWQIVPNKKRVGER